MEPVAKGDTPVVPQSSDRDSERTANPNGQGAVKQIQGDVTVSKAAAIVLVLALGAHAFFEGIAFGL